MDWAWSSIEQKLKTAEEQTITAKEALEIASFMELSAIKETLQTELFDVPNVECDEQGSIPEKFRGQQCISVLNFIVLLAGQLNIDAFPMMDTYKEQIHECIKSFKKGPRPL